MTDDDRKRIESHYCGIIDNAREQLIAVVAAKEYAESLVERATDLIDQIESNLDNQSRLCAYEGRMFPEDSAKLRHAVGAWLKEVKGGTGG